MLKKIQSLDFKFKTEYTLNQYKCTILLLLDLVIVYIMYSIMNDTLYLQKNHAISINNRMIKNTPYNRALLFNMKSSMYKVYEIQCNNICDFKKYVLDTCIKCV